MELKSDLFIYGSNIMFIELYFDVAVLSFEMNGLDSGLHIDVSSSSPFELHLVVSTTTGAWPSPQSGKNMFEYKLYVTGM